MDVALAVFCIYSINHEASVVSILVVVDVALAVRGARTTLPTTMVSILVVVDVALAEFETRYIKPPKTKSQSLL